jgi:hypothetical protein
MMLFNIDQSPTDMYLLNGQNELAIQGEGFYDENAIYPIGIAGKISFALDEIKISNPINPSLFWTNSLIHIILLLVAFMK